ncbi:hypothetical protein OIDMADRAFT_21560 [Oidiodendron maius Zn]|uniref:Uncharacterized protein n=1 Tax=Oidiodendron maius (strain Zn) TaxID=913774 RepID=A0A0C3CTU3_OIDMZ|nr:hypothetical protein OIDMADRAFT_21560 [Oidiodendron maius Zn]
MLDFSSYILEGAWRRYTPVSFPLPGALIFAAHDCRATILRDFTPAEPTQQETAQRMKAPSVAHLHPPLILLFLNNPQTGYNFRLSVQACSI